MRKFTSTDKQNITSRLFAFFLLIGTLMFMGSCRDTTELEIPVPDTENTRTELEMVKNPDGLIQQTDRTWKAVDKRVPLVGVGRVVNSFGSPLLEVIDGKSDNFGKIVDTNIDNYTSFTTSGVSASVTSVNLVSVRDIYRTYAGGQQAGFVLHFEETANLLSLDLLKNMEIHFYKDGGEQASVKLAGDNGQAAVGLKLLAFDNGNNGIEQALSVTCPSDKSFDEIQLVINGTGLSLFSSGIDVKYAFVGDNEDKIAATNHNADFWGNNFPVVNTDKDFTSNSLSDKDAVTDESITNSQELKTASLLGGLLGGSDQYITVNFQKEIPAGYEVGFLYSIGSSILGLDLLGASGPELYTYDSYGNKTGSQVAKTSLLSLDLLNSKADQMRAGYTLEEPSSQVKIKATDGFFNIIGKLPIVGGLLGAKKSIYVYYAYVREPVTVDVSSYFSIGDTEIYKSDYELPASSDGSVIYNMISQPYGASATVSGNTLTGATKEGAYIIQAIYTSPTGKGVSHVFTVYRKINKAAGSESKYITNASHGAYPSEPLNNDGGCLLCLFNNVNSLNAIVDNNLDNYAVYTQVLGLVENTPLAAIELIKPVNSVLEDIRTGFVVQANSGLLEVSLLNNLEIRLYNNGERIKTGNTASTGTDVLGVDLISGGSDKFRVYVNTNQQFDRIELWVKQGVGLSLFNNFRMYGVFYEDADEKQTSANEVCMEVMNYLNHGLEIDYDRTGESGGLVNVNLLGGTTYGLSNLLDNDLNTGMSVSSLLKLGVLKGDLQVALKFNEMPVSRPIGVVLEADGGLLDLDLTALGNYVSVSILSDGQEICKAQNASVLDLNLLESEKRIYFELIPEYNFETGVSASYYDGIVISLGGGLLDLSLNEIKVTGIYTRVDSDGDGIPDCVDTEKEELIDITGVARTCEGEPLVIPIFTDAAVGSEYLLSFDNLTSGGKYDKVVGVSFDSGETVFSVDGLPYGKYTFDVISQGSGKVLVSDAQAYVHAQLTEWTGAAGTDWNNWDNWTKGAPWTCTDVIIRKDALEYPELTSGVTNCCARIHFEEGSYIQYINHLKYDLAFVDMLINGGDYRIITTPLYETYSGDFFVNTGVNWTKDYYFTSLNNYNYPEKRVSPIVYQRIWGTEAGNNVWQILEDGSQTKVSVGVSGWTEDFNYLNYEHIPGKGISLRAGEEGELTSYRFRFPKEYTKYNYFYSDGTSSNRTENISRGSKIGKLVTDENYTLFGLQTSGTNVVAVGNPFMSVLSIEGFLAENLSIQSIVLDNYTIEAKNGTSNVPSDERRKYINPAEGFLINSLSQKVDVTFSADNVYSSASAAARSSRSANNSKHALFMEARCGGNVSNAAVWSFSGADDGLNEKEDVVVMTDSKNMRAVEVFTIADGKALAIQCMNNLNRIPVGLMVDGSKEVTLKIQTDDAKWKGWVLEDTLTGKQYSLTGGEVEIDLGSVKTTLSRLFLQKL